MSTTDFYQSVIQATWVNNKKKPFDDPRVRRALHLVLDRPVLVDVVKDVAPMMVGGFIYPFSEFATPKDELAKRLGYQADPTAAIKEAKALLAAAGHADGIKGLDFLVREVAIFKLWAQAIQAMLQEALNIEMQAAHRRRIGVVRRRQDRQLRPGDRRHRVDPARPLGLFQRLVQARTGRRITRFWDNEKFNELLAADRPRGRSRPSAWR